MAKLNCWEVKNCGRAPGGGNADELGVCPATTDKRLDGTHEGKNAGRACWTLAGTFCGGKVQGTYAQKYGNCSICDFYYKVKFEEGTNYEFIPNILKRLAQTA